MTTPTGGIKISELLSGSFHEQEAKIDQLFKAALWPTEQQLAEQQRAVAAQIVKFERRYEMSSSVMLQKLSEGLIKETADICSWLMLIKVNDDFYSEPSNGRWIMAITQS